MAVCTVHPSFKQSWIASRLWSVVCCCWPEELDVARCSAPSECPDCRSILYFYYFLTLWKNLKRKIIGKFNENWFICGGNFSKFSLLFLWLFVWMIIFSFIYFVVYSLLTRTVSGICFSKKGICISFCCWVRQRATGFWEVWIL